MKNMIFKSYLKKILRSEAFISVIIVFVLALGIIGTSYALYMDVDTDSDYQLVEVGDLKIDFDHKNNSTNPDDYSKIELENVTPTEDSIALSQTDNIFSFRIYNSGTYDVDYNIKLVTADGNQVDAKYINYQICKDNALCDNVNTLFNTSDSIIKIGQLESLNDNTTNSDYYFLRVWINNQYPESEWGKSNALVLRVMIEASNVSARSLVSNVIKNAKSGIEGRSIYTEPDKLPTKPAEEINGENERILSYTEDDHGTSYYFRGNVEDNYVNFAGMCWRIVRIDGLGNTKLILEDQDELCSEDMNGNWDIGSGNYGYQSKNANSDGYIEDIISYLNPITEKTSSMVKAFYDFQTTKLADYLNKLKSGGWCFDLVPYNSVIVNNSTSYIKLEDYNYDSSMFYGSFVRMKVADGYYPTFKCSGTILNEFVNVSGVSSVAPMYVSAMTVDEAAYAGGKSGTSNQNNYLINNYQKENQSYFWLLSPSKFGPYNDKVFNLNYNGIFGGADVSISYLFRPVISLKTSVSIINGGDGTINKPYQVD